jgi:hypothetical protein
MMKNILTEWRKYVNEELTDVVVPEQKKYPRFPDFDINKVDFQLKFGKLRDLLARDKKIKQLRVPSWSLQTDAYMHPGENDVAAVVYDGKKPVAITALTEDKYTGNGLINVYVDTWYRGLNLASKTFDKVMENSEDWEFIIASRVPVKMFKARGYEATDQGCGYVDCVVFKNKNYKS